MSENPRANEPLLAMQFIEKSLKGTEPPRCVDGRQDPNSPEGPQMLGGSLHPLVVSAIASGKDFDQTFVKQQLKILHNSKGFGHALGIHWGAHRNYDTGVSDCGFADRLKDVLATAINNENEIKLRLERIYKANNLDPLSLDTAYSKLRNYSPEQIKTTGKILLIVAEHEGAVKETVLGDHNEEVAFVNLKKGTTFDTQKANQQAHQAFNLDLLIAQEQSEQLGVAPILARDLSLILYQATEMVLVESKGKPPLPVVMHK